MHLYLTQHKETIIELLSADRTVWGKFSSLPIRGSARWKVVRAKAMLLPLLAVEMSDSLVYHL
jgi:hypothetical protein